MTNDWQELHISDKTGGVFFKCVASPMATFSEIKNLKQRLKAAKKSPEHFKFLDIESAHIVLDGEIYTEPTADDLEAILAELDA